jgi:hypothetical protein
MLLLQITIFLESKGPIYYFINAVKCYNHLINMKNIVEMAFHMPLLHVKN